MVTVGRTQTLTIKHYSTQGRFKIEEKAKDVSIRGHSTANVDDTYSTLATAYESTMQTIFNVHCIPIPYFDLKK